MTDGAQPPPTVPGGNPKDPLSEEDRLWSVLMEEPHNEERHKAYFSYIIRNGLLKEASRRYNIAVNSKDALSVAVRRQFRKYHQTLLNLMFMSASPAPVQKKNSALPSFLLAISGILILAGILIPSVYFKIGAFIGTGIIIAYYVRTVRAIRIARNEKHPFQD